MSSWEGLHNNPQQDLNKTEISIVMVVIMNDQVNLHMINVQINEYYFLVTGKGLVNMRTFSSLYYK